jgi:ribonuclease P/MRP protein subunit POP1
MKSLISGLGCGWDVIAPLGWGMPFWRCFIMQGARTGGLREFQALCTESLVPYVPQGCPDTAAGLVEQQLIMRDAREQFFK